MKTGKLIVIAIVATLCAAFVFFLVIPAVRERFFGHDVFVPSWADPDGSAGGKWTSYGNTRPTPSAPSAAQRGYAIGRGAIPGGRSPSGGR